MLETILPIIFIILLAPALVLVFIPMFPTLPYMFIVTLVYAFINEFEDITGIRLIIFGALLLLGTLVDYLSGVLGAKYGGASRNSILAGFLGAIAGTFLLPPFGGIIGLFFAVLLAELVQFKNRKKALKAATFSFLGTLAGIIVNFFLALIFFILFIVFVV